MQGPALLHKLIRPRKDREARIAEVRQRSIKGAIHIRSAEGRGVGRNGHGADADALAREAAARALRVVGR